MKLQVSRSGYLVGEFDESSIKDGLASGRLRRSDLYFADGMAEWRELADFVDDEDASPPDLVAVEKGEGLVEQELSIAQRTAVEGKLSGVMLREAVQESGVPVGTPVGNVDRATPDTPLTAQSTKGEGGGWRFLVWCSLVASFYFYFTGIWCIGASIGTLMADVEGDSGSMVLSLLLAGPFSLALGWLFVVLARSAQAKRAIVQGIEFSGIFKQDPTRKNVDRNFLWVILLSIVGILFFPLTFGAGFFAIRGTERSLARRANLRARQKPNTGPLP